MFRRKMKNEKLQEAPSAELCGDKIITKAWSCVVKANSQSTTPFSLAVREITNQQTTNTLDSDERVVTGTDDLITVIIRCDGTRPVEWAGCTSWLRQPAALHVQAHLKVWGCAAKFGESCIYSQFLMNVEGLNNVCLLWRIYQADILLFGHAYRQWKHCELYFARIKFIFIKTSEKV